MKVIQLLGTKDKTEFTLYLAHTLSTFGKRVLIIDATENQRYYYGFTTLEEDEHLYELSNIDVLTGAFNWDSASKLLEKEDMKIADYECVLVDIDSISTLIGEWPEFDATLYISDNDRFNIEKDVSLLHRWMDENEETMIDRIHFETPNYKLLDGLITLKTDNRVQFSPFSENIVYEDVDYGLRLRMQHEQLIPINKLSKSYKKILEDFVRQWFGENELLVVKPKKSFFKFRNKDKEVQDKEIKEKEIVGG